MAMAMKSREMEKCIKDCNECAAVCAQTAHHCLQLGGEHASPEHQALMLDCVDICAAAVGFMARSSQFASAHCRLCAEVCNACADSCEDIAGGDQAMKHCAKICRQCSQSCDQMAGVNV